jgi:valyl-tRNA synthetase
VLAGAIPAQAAQLVVGEATLILPLAGLIDLDAERSRLGKERDQAAAELEKVRHKLENADFVARAKPEVVEENRERLVGFEADLVRLSAALARISVRNDGK